MLTLSILPNFKGTKDEKISTLIICLLLDFVVVGIILNPLM